MASCHFSFHTRFAMLVALHEIIADMNCKLVDSIFLNEQKNLAPRRANQLLSQINTISLFCVNFCEGSLKVESTCPYFSEILTFEYLKYPGKPAVSMSIANYFNLTALEESNVRWAMSEIYRRSTNFEKPSGNKIQIRPSLLPGTCWHAGSDQWRAAGFSGEVEH